jgi:hypothetical protein
MAPSRITASLPAQTRTHDEDAPCLARGQLLATTSRTKELGRTSCCWGGEHVHHAFTASRIGMEGTLDGLVSAMV